LRTPLKRAAIRAAVPATVVALILAGCTAQDDSSSTSPTSTTADTGTGTTIPASTDADLTVESAMAQNTAPHEGDASYDESTAVDVTLADGSSSSSSDAVSVDGDTVTIAAGGTYRLSGTLADGQVVVTAPDQDVTLVLDGVDLTSSTTSPLQVLEADDVHVVLADGSDNGLTDTSAYADDDEASGALFSAGDLTITGDGSLDVTGNGNDGIVGKDGLVVASGTLTVDAVDDGIRGKDYLVVEGGTLTVTAGGDALKSDDDEDATLGYVLVNDGTLDLTAGDDGLTAATDVLVAGGTLDVATGGGADATVADDASPKGLVGDAAVVVGGGTLAVDAADDAIHSDAVVSITDGALTLASGDDAVHGEYALQVAGGTLDVTQAVEGLEAQEITILDGTITLVTSDDGLNGSTADGSADETATGDQAQQGGGFGGGGGGMEAADENVSVIIAGGTLVVDAQGDGLDSNGNLTMTGGTVGVFVPTYDGNGSLDYAGTFEITGGELIAVGSSGMAQTPSGGTQSFVGITLSQQGAAGDVVQVVSSDGDVLASLTAVKPFSSVVYSSPDVVDGATYTAVLGGTAGDAVAGPLSRGGTAGTTTAGTGTAGEVAAGMAGPGGAGGPSGGRPGDGGQPPAPPSA